MNTPRPAPPEIDVLLHQTNIQNLTHLASAMGQLAFSLARSQAPETRAAAMCLLGQLEVINIDLTKQWNLLHLLSGHTESAQGSDHPNIISRLDISDVDTPSLRRVNT